MYALEMRRGWFNTHALAPGAHVLGLEHAPRAPLQNAHRASRGRSPTPRVRAKPVSKFVRPGTRPTALRKQIGRLLEYFGSDPKAESFCPIARAGNFEMHQRCEEVASLLLRREFGASTQRCAAPCQCTEGIVKVSRSLVARARSDRARGQQGHVRPIGAAEAATQDRRRRPAGHGRVDPDQVAASPCAGQPAGCRCGAATDRDRRGFP